LSSLIAPRGPTREIRLWRGRSFKLIGESDEAICAWLNNRFSERLKPKDLKTEAALLMWLDEPPLPSEYPYKARTCGGSPNGLAGMPSKLLERVASSCPEEIVVVIGADARHGLGYLRYVRPQAPARAKGQRGGPRLDRDTEKAKFPSKLPCNATSVPSQFFALRLTGLMSPWVHGRGQDPRSDRLWGLPPPLSVADRLVRLSQSPWPKLA
jgi:hypothetical protein